MLNRTKRGLQRHLMDKTMDAGRAIQTNSLKWKLKVQFLHFVACLILLFLPRPQPDVFGIFTLFLTPFLLFAITSSTLMYYLSAFNSALLGQTFINSGFKYAETLLDKELEEGEYDISERETSLKNLKIEHFLFSILTLIIGCMFASISAWSLGKATIFCLLGIFLVSGVTYFSILIRALRKIDEMQESCNQWE